MAEVTSNNANEIGAIVNNLPGRAMRVAMENKDLLRGKGQLYAGTSKRNNFNVVGMDGVAVSYSIAQTAATPTPPEDASAENPYILVYTGEGETGFVWKKFN